MDRIEYIRQINMRLNELEAKVEAIEQYLQNTSEKTQGAGYLVDWDSPHEI